MSERVKIGQFEYWSDMLEVAKTAMRYAHEYNRRKSDPVLSSGPQHGYSTFMYGRRAGEFSYAYWQQRNQIHSLQLVLDGDPVCNCGLIAKCDSWDDSEQEIALLNAEGHIINEGQEVVRAFCRSVRATHDESNRLEFFCQICATAKTSGVSQNENINRSSLKKFQKEHLHNG
jgi:hypothetical protein